ncbi:MAG: ROK family transcriptional regulator [Candidatus Dormibacteria bacterium]
MENTSPLGGSRVARGGAANRVLRELNRSMVLDMLRASGTLSRGEIADRTGLSKQTVGSIVDELVRGGLAIDAPTDCAPPRGRPPRVVQFNGDIDAFIGVEIGSTRVRVGVADGGGRLLATDSATVAGGPGGTVEQVAALTDELLHTTHVPRTRLRRCGVATAGLVDRSRGRVVTSAALGWGDVDLGTMLSAALALPVTVVNRVAAATLAEGRAGATESIPSYVWVYSGTGIGAGIVVDGALISGTSGFAGELGHSPAGDDGALCACGNRGCLETVAGAAAITAAARAAVAAGDRTSLRGLASIEAVDVAGAAASGDRVAQGILAAAGAQLGLGVAHLVNILNPSTVVIGGPLADSAAYLDALVACVDRHTLRAERVPVVHSTLGPDASLLGAVHLAVEGGSPSYRIVDIRAASA